MKTLVIHPTDITTDFLKPIWEANPDWTVVRSTTISKGELRRQIKLHEKVVCLGHGSEQGLFGKNRFLIDSTLVQLLREKVCVFVWCNADVFFKKYTLKGFVTGMIISEADEALMCCVPFTSGDVKKANEKLAIALTNSISLQPSRMYKTLVEEFVPETSIESFNSMNFYLYDY